MYMEIISKSIYIINYEDGRIYSREIPNSFNEYLNELINHVNTNISVRDYKTRSQKTQVVGDIKSIILKAAGNTDDLGYYFNDIAERLLHKEIEVQGRIARLNISVQKGSLIQSLLFDSTNTTAKNI